MTDAMNVPREPCPSCPYRRDCPSGLWHPDEYAKLPRFDEDADDPHFAEFLCHHTTPAAPSLCRGWLSVHAESVAVRLAVVRGHVRAKDVRARVRAALFSTGAEAAAHGLRSVARPGRAARAMIRRLEQKISRRRR